MRKYLIVSTLALGGLTMYACNEEVEQVEVESQDLLSKDVVEMVIDAQPEFPGGSDELYAYLGENIQYPEQAKKIGVEGKVYVQFEVTPTGEIRNVVAVKGIGAGADEEAVRVVGSMPNWEPATKDGVPVATTQVVPINFVLE